jgi:hypothetical protein
MKPALPLLAAALVATPVLAEEKRELGAHEHGVGVLNIAIEGTTVALELFAPGADIVGFEYEAKSDEDVAKVDAAVASLGAPLELFVMPSAAGCTVTDAAVQLEIEGEDDHGDHGHDDHDHDEAKDEHGHDDHDHDHDEAKDEHGHDDHDHEEAKDDHGHDDHDHDHDEAKDEHGHDDHDHAEVAGGGGRLFPWRGTHYAAR